MRSNLNLDIFQLHDQQTDNMDHIGPGYTFCCLTISISSPITKTQENMFPIVIVPLKNSFIVEITL